MCSLHCSCPKVKYYGGGGEGVQGEEGKITLHVLDRGGHYSKHMGAL